MPVRRSPARQTRHPVRVPVESEPLGGGGKAQEGESEDLSQGGISLRLPSAVAPGSLVRVTLRLHRRPRLTVTGKVVWVRPHADLRGWAVGIRLDESLPEEMVVEIADEEYPPWKGSR